jgi:DNA processing protein
LLSFYPQIEDAVSDNFNKINPLEHKWVARWSQVKNYSQELNKFEESLLSSKVNILSCLSSDYPERLKDLSDYPIVLYFQGSLDVLKHNLLVTVVGSRNYTKYAELALSKIMKPLCIAGVGVVSGLAVGIDGLSHRLALENNSPTIGVIGSGLDDSNFYPGEHLGLKNQILGQGGLVFSEYAPGTKATHFTFPARNRILAALSSLTLVIQANQKSGSLITAREALELGRQVATIPGSILDVNLSGNMKLLKEGANLITDSQDVFQLLGVQPQSLFDTPKKIDFNSAEEELVYKNLGLEPQNIQTISEKVGLDISMLGSHLTMLEISNLAINLGENNWAKCS